MKRNEIICRAGRLAGPAALCAGGLVWLAAVLAAGGGPLELAAFAGLFFVAILCAGRFLTGLAAPGLEGAARLAAAFCAGSGVLLAAWWLLGRWGAWAALAPGLALGAAGAAEWLREKPRLRPALPRGPVSLLQLFMGMFLFFHAFWGVLPAATPERLRVWTYNQDLLWSVGNAAAAAFGAPFQDMRMAGYTLHYHFLNDLAAGLLARAAGAGAWEGLAFYWYAPVGLLALGALWALAKRLGAGEWLAALGAGAVFFMNSRFSEQPFHLFTNTNGMGTALLGLCGVLLLADRALEEEKLPRAFWPCFFAACAALCMIKSTLGALALCAFAAALAVSLAAGRLRPRMAALAALCAGAFGACWALVFRGAVNNLMFSGAARLGELPEALVNASLLGLVLYLASLPWSLARLRRLTFAQLCVNAIAVGGPAAFALYTHYSFSQVYFLLAAIPMWWLAALPALAAYGRWLAARRAALRPLAAGALAAACLAAFGWQLSDVVPECREGVQAALRCAGLRVSEPAEESVLAGDWQAARWLRENSEAGDIFATNRNNKTLAGADGVFHFYTAASQRRSYLESYRYALDYDNAYAETRRRLEEVSDAIFFRLSEEEAFRLAAQEGIDWLLVSTRVEGWPQWQRTPDFATDAVRLYRVPAAS